MDAITLSMADLAGKEGGIAVPVAARAIVLAVVASTLVKGRIALTAGAVTLQRALLPPFLAMLVVAAVVAFFIF